MRLHERDATDLSDRHRVPVDHAQPQPLADADADAGADSDARPHAHSRLDLYGYDGPGDA